LFLSNLAVQARLQNIILLFTVELLSIMHPCKQTPNFKQYRPIAKPRFLNVGAPT